jgi:ferritin
MIPPKIEKAFNKQLNAEIYAGYLYFAIGAWFEERNLEGFAAWMKSQAFEELSHAMRFYNHIMERGGKIELDSLEKPQVAWTTPVEAFQAAYEHELKVTKMINDLVELAQAEKDNAAIYGILNWFVEEQIEEEEQTLTAVEKLKMVKAARTGFSCWIKSTAPGPCLQLSR